MDRNQWRPSTLHQRTAFGPNACIHPPGFQPAQRSPSVSTPNSSPQGYPQASPVIGRPPVHPIVQAGIPNQHFQQPAGLPAPSPVFLMPTPQVSPQQFANPPAYFSHNPQTYPFHMMQPSPSMFQQNTQFVNVPIAFNHNPIPGFTGLPNSHYPNFNFVPNGPILPNNNLAPIGPPNSFNNNGCNINPSLPNPNNFANTTNFEVRRVEVVNSSNSSSFTDMRFTNNQNPIYPSGSSCQETSNNSAILPPPPGFGHPSNSATPGSSAPTDFRHPSIPSNFVSPSQDPNNLSRQTRSNISAPRNSHSKPQASTYSQSVSPTSLSHPVEESVSPMDEISRNLDLLDPRPIEDYKGNTPSAHGSSSDTSSHNQSFSPADRLLNHPYKETFNFSNSIKRLEKPCFLSPRETASTPSQRMNNHIPDGSFKPKVPSIDISSPSSGSSSPEHPRYNPPKAATRKPTPLFFRVSSSNPSSPQVHSRLISMRKDQQREKRFSKSPNSQTDSPNRSRSPLKEKSFTSFSSRQTDSPNMPRSPKDRERPKKSSSSSQNDSHHMSRSLQHKHKSRNRSSTFQTDSPDKEITPGPSSRFGMDDSTPANTSASRFTKDNTPSEHPGYKAFTTPEINQDGPASVAKIQSINFALLSFEELTSPSLALKISADRENPLISKQVTVGDIKRANETDNTEDDEASPMRVRNGTQTPQSVVRKINPVLGEQFYENHPWIDPSHDVMDPVEYQNSKDKLKLGDDEDYVTWLSTAFPLNIFDRKYWEVPPFGATDGSVVIARSKAFYHGSNILVDWDECKISYCLVCKCAIPLEKCVVMFAFLYHPDHPTSVSNFYKSGDDKACYMHFHSANAKRTSKVYKTTAKTNYSKSNKSVKLVTNRSKKYKL